MAMADGRLEQRVTRIAVVSGLSTVISILLQILSVPICLSYWGTEAYGAWLALFSVLMLMQTPDKGFTAFVGNKLNLQFHESHSALRQTLSSALVGTLVIGVVQTACLVLIISFDAIGEIIGASDAFLEKHHVNVAIGLLLGTWIVRGPFLGVVHRLLVPTGLMYQAAWWSVGSQIAQFMAIVGAALMQLSIVHTSVMFSAVDVLFSIASAAYFRRRLPEFYPWWRNPSISVGLRDLRQSVTLMASSIVQMGTGNGIVITVSAIAGPGAVPAFTTVRTLVNLWANIANVLSNPLLPDVVRYHANRETGKLIATVRVHWVIVTTVVNLGILLTYPLLGPLYEVWTAQTMELNRTLLCLLLASVTLVGIGALVTTYLNGINALRIVLTMSLIRAVLSVGVGAIMLYYFDLAGLGMAILLGELLVIAFMADWLSKASFVQGRLREIALSLGPLALSTCALFVFLAVEARSNVFAVEAFGVSVLAVLLAGVWGWRNLDVGVRERIVLALKGWRWGKLT